MAKRGNSGKRTTGNNTMAAQTAATPDPMEQRVVAFAEQLGRIVGTVQAKAEGWMDREALSKQIASVRDGAADLLDQMKTSVTNVTGTAEPEAETAAPAPRAARSGGVVDAPGKKHRKPMPADPRAVAADAKRSNRQAGKSGMKTMKRRGRG